MLISFFNRYSLTISQGIGRLPLFGTTFFLWIVVGLNTLLVPTNHYNAKKVAQVMNCTGTATVASNNGVTGATNAEGTANGSYAELYQGTDVIVLDLGEALTASTTITVYFQRVSGNAPIWTISSSNSTSGFSGVAESPVDLSFVSAGTVSTFTITVPAGHRYVEIASNGTDAGLDAFEFTCPSNGGPVVGNLSCSAGATEISGIVYEDIDYDGIYDSGELQGLENITVTATDSLGNSFSTTTNSSGAYSLTGLLAARTYRIEFTNIPDWAITTLFGGDNGTTVQFYTAGNCANLGLSSPASYCQTNPTIGLTCWQNGTGLDNPMDPGYAYFPWTISGNVQDGATAPSYGPTFVEIGTAWGSAYQREAEQIYLSAVLRRHSTVGPTGLGGIYTLSDTGTLLGSFDLQGVTPANGGGTLDFGSVTRSTVTGGISSGAAGDNQLSDDPMEATRDIDAFAKVGAVGYGDIDFEGDGTTLWVTNLNDGELISVETQNPSNSLPTDGSQVAGAIVNRYTMSSLAGYPSCTGGLFRPWALSFNKGRGYLGGVCSAETNQNANNLEAYVLSFDPNNMAAGFTTELNFPLDFTRETPSSFRDPDLIGAWQPWANTNAQVTYMTQGKEFVDQGAPVLTDIVFAKDGDMTLGFIDRESLQFGILQYKPLSGQNDLVDREGGGDIYHACLISGSWVIENTTTCGVSDTGAGTSSALTTDGPSGSGEYYYGDYYRHNNSSDEGHDEITHGGLVYSPGNDQIISNAYDPLNRNEGGDTNSQGVITFNSSGGEKVNGYQFSRITEIGKSAALGDLEAFCDPAPIEIGNYVWIDTDGDGVQDAGEPSVDSIIIELYDAAGNLVATDTTDSNGQYYFSSDATDNATWVTANNGLDFNTTYYIVTGGNGQYANGEITIDGTVYTLTATGADADQIDNDGAIASGIDPDFDGEPYVEIITGGAGHVNHTYDFGFVLPSTCTNPDLVTTPEAICLGDNVELDTLVTDDNSVGSTIVFYNTLADANNQSNPLSSAIVSPTIDAKYYVRKDTASCLDIDSILVTILSNPTAMVADVLKCTKDGETISVMPSGGMGPYTYNWSGPYDLSGETGDNFITSVPGTYTVTVTDNEGCTSTSNGEMTFQSKVCLPVTFTIKKGTRN